MFVCNCVTTRYFIFEVGLRLHEGVTPKTLYCNAVSCGRFRFYLITGILAFAYTAQMKNDPANNL